MKKFQTLAMLAALSAVTYEPHHKYGKPQYLRKGNGGSVDGSSVLSADDKNRAKGLKPFHFPGEKLEVHTIWALNEANAQRKAKNKGLI